jgi:glycosyl transferase family 25
MKPIQCFVANLAKRVDRRESILNEFKGKDEFEVHIVPAIEDKIGNSGIFMTFQKIIHDYIDHEADFSLFCEDDHIFTKKYHFRLLQDVITGNQPIKIDKKDDSGKIL